MYVHVISFSKTTEMIRKTNLLPVKSGMNTWWKPKIVHYFVLSANCLLCGINISSQCPGIRNVFFLISYNFGFNSINQNIEIILYC